MGVLTYKIGKVNPNYCSEWTYRGYKFKVHRPVSEEGRKLAKGWQFSINGVPIGIICPDNDTKKSAISMAKQKMDRVPDAELAERIREVREKNAYVYCNGQAT